MLCLILFERCQSSCEEHGTSEHYNKILSTVGCEPPTPHGLQNTNHHIFDILNGFWRNLTGSKSSTSSAKFMGFLSCRSVIQDGRPGLWFAEEFFDFSSVTSKWIFRNLTRSKSSNVLQKVSVYVSIRHLRWPSWPLIGCFRLSRCSRWVDFDETRHFFDETWQEASPKRPLPGFGPSCRSAIQDDRPGLWLAFSSQLLNGFRWNIYRKQACNIPYQICVF